MKPRISKKGQEILSSPTLSAALMEAVNALGTELTSGKTIFFGDDKKYSVTIASATTISTSPEHTR